MAEVSAVGSTAVALAGGVEAASAAGAAVTAGEGGVGAAVAGAVAAGAMPDGAIHGGGGAIRMAMAMTMGRDGVPITPATATPAYGGGRSCWAHRKVWTQPGGRGHYLGRRLVNVCQ